ncbi:MAG: GntR family transcriptional regulator [Subtercola sp.]|nr:GntR family transcriptional regulator [Subtercola sp.]
MDETEHLAEALGRARSGSAQRIRELLQTSPRRAHVLLRASIRRGIIRADEHVEEDSLVMSMMMSRNSIRSALHMLGSEGLITRRQRLGTTVVGSIAELPLLELLPVAGWTSGAEEDYGASGLDLEIQQLEQAEVLADVHIRGRLNLTSDRVILQEDLISRRGQPLGIVLGYYPTEGVTITDPQSMRDRINSVRGIEVSRIEATVEAVNCDERTARVLGIAEGAAILVRETLVLDSEGVPRMLAYGHYRGDRVALRAADNAVPGMQRT